MKNKITRQELQDDVIFTCEEHLRRTRTGFYETQFIKVDLECLITKLQELNKLEIRFTKEEENE